MTKANWLLAALLEFAMASDTRAANHEIQNFIIKIDGSSTVFPITEAVAEEFQKENRGVKVTVGISGTGGGFKKFTKGETHISDASRRIKPPELKECKKNGINFIEIPVAYDGLSVLVNKDNNWCNTLTTAELKKIWEPDAKGKVVKWSDVWAGWPDKKMTLYGPGTDSGTFDYFTKAINGKEKASRPDYIPSEDDNILVQGIAREHIPHIFERFYRVDKSRSPATAPSPFINGGSQVERAGGGTGLGLAIVKHVVQLHRGDIVVESEPGRGSKFSVTLPAKL